MQVEDTETRLNETSSAGMMLHIQVDEAAAGVSEAEVLVGAERTAC